MPHQYTFDVDGKKYSWNKLIDTLKQNGVKDVDISYGPQAGYWLTIVGAAIALIAGALMLVMRTKPVAVPSGPPQAFPPPNAPQQGYPAPQAYQPQQGYAPPPPAPTDQPPGRHSA